LKNFLILSCVLTSNVVSSAYLKFVIRLPVCYSSSNLLLS